MPGTELPVSADRTSRGERSRSNRDRTRSRSGANPVGLLATPIEPLVEPSSFREQSEREAIVYITAAMDFIWWRGKGFQPVAGEGISAGIHGWRILAAPGTARKPDVTGSTIDRLLMEGS